MKHLWINGQSVPTEHYQVITSPFSNNELDKVSEATIQDVHHAISVAKQAFLTYKKTPAHKRAEILMNVVHLLRENHEECSKLITLESGKAIKDARKEMDRTIMTYTFAAEEARRLTGQTIPLDAAPGGENRVAYTVREPLGVIGAITPFNFPMNLVAHKVGPAIASGNTVVLKPASQTPLSSYKLAELLQQAGLPDGVLNVVTGKGNIVGNALVESKDVKMITFTGSPLVGKAIREKAGLKKVTLELGSNSALIIDKDVSLSPVIKRIVTGAFSYQGQVCISIQQIFVHENVYEEFLNLFQLATKDLILGDPLNEDTDLSCMISPEETERILNWVREAVGDGATIVAGGEVMDGIMTPTILTDVPRNAKISCQEAFAPVVAIYKISDLNEAIDRVNESPYGLQAGVYTNNLQSSFKACQELHVGGVMINDIPTFRVDQMPYGGVKESGTGREGIPYSIEEMTEIKLVTFNLNS
ncbi:aldehyde dehydrogenase [Bacillus coahuilensis m2-6]|uniref:aldehyde dehydrogenase family protein n=1 Tax=Bacillus coahuilensis TaxID=408580 RepID=UPI0007502F95|nr:aldehyde dehydrogenase family protein [Bacillus coahuilensis]KUP07966.1 aldehyde dehydrogenase [Bacillus coahuilensis m2-6]